MYRRLQKVVTHTILAFSKQKTNKQTNKTQKQKQKTKTSFIISFNIFFISWHYCKRDVQIILFQARIPRVWVALQ